MTAKHIRLYREHAAKCRDLARMIDTLRQRLMDVAMECGDRPREAVGPVTLSNKEAAGAFGIGRSTLQADK